VTSSAGYVLFFTVRTAFFKLLRSFGAGDAVSLLLTCFLTGVFLFYFVHGEPVPLEEFFFSSSFFSFPVRNPPQRTVSTRVIRWLPIASWNPIFCLSRASPLLFFSLRIFVFSPLCQKKVLSFGSSLPSGQKFRRDLFFPKVRQSLCVNRDAEILASSKRSLFPLPLWAG